MLAVCAFVVCLHARPCVVIAVGGLLPHALIASVFLAFFFVVATALSLELGAHTYGAQQSTPAEHGADPGVDRVVQVPRRERWRDCNVDREAVSKPRARGTDERGDGRKGGQTEGSLRSEHDAHRALQ